MPSKVDGDLTVTGNLLAGSMSLPANAVGDVNFNAADPLTCDKQNHQYLERYQQPIASTVVAGREVIHVAQGAGSIEDFTAMLAGVVNSAGATVTVTLYKNGASITSVAAVVTDAQALREQVSGTLTTLTYAAGDVFEIGVVISGSIGKGIVVQVVFREAA